MLKLKIINHKNSTELFNNLDLIVDSLVFKKTKKQELTGN